MDLIFNLFSAFLSPTLQSPLTEQWGMIKKDIITFCIYETRVFYFPSLEDRCAARHVAPHREPAFRQRRAAASLPELPSEGDLRQVTFSYQNKLWRRPYILQHLREQHYGEVDRECLLHLCRGCGHAHQSGRLEWTNHTQPS